MTHYLLLFVALVAVTIGGVHAAGGQRKKLAEQVKTLTEALEQCRKNVAPKTCPNGWTTFESSCYFVSTETKTWNEAKTACEGLGAVLVEIGNAAENEFVKKLGANRVIWLGASDAETEGRWILAGSKAPVSFTGWCANEPNSNGGDEDCLDLRVISGAYCWNDVGCDYRSIFVCEKSL